MEEYELSPHRFRELKHFCLQYHELKEELESLRGKDGYELNHYDPTSALAIRENEIIFALKLIETTAHDTESFLEDKILRVVTEDLNVNRLTMPCSRDCMDELRRKFYWLLDKRKGI